MGKIGFVFAGQGGKILEWVKAFQNAAALRRSFSEKSTVSDLKPQNSALRQMQSSL